MYEYFLNNRIENTFQKFLYPLNLTDFLVYSPKYCISDNFITPNNNKTKWRSFCCSFCYLLMFTLLFVYNSKLSDYYYLVYYFFLIIDIIIISSFIINFIVNSIQSDVHVDFVITIHKVQKSLKFSKFDYQSFVIGNWIYMFILYFSYILLLGTHLYQNNLTISLCFYYIALMISDANIIYLVRVIQLLNHVTITWMSELKYLDKVTTYGLSTVSLNLKPYRKTLIKAYLDITKAARLYEEMAKIPIIFYMISDLFNVLFHVEVLLSYPKDFWANLIAGLLWTFKYFFLIAIISFKTEDFFTTLKNTQVVSLMRDAKVKSSGERMLYKNILRAGYAACIARESGAFGLNATLPLSFLSCIATYVVVLLQFKF
nr:gustatory receptor 29.2 [Papilio memnon]